MDDSFRLVTNERRTRISSHSRVEDVCVFLNIEGKGSDGIEYTASIILSLKIFEQEKEESYNEEIKTI